MNTELQEPFTFTTYLPPGDATAVFMVVKGLTVQIPQGIKGVRIFDAEGRYALIEATGVGGIEFDHPGPHTLQLLGHDDMAKRDNLRVSISKDDYEFELKRDNRT